jgi:hypothetical protein
MRNSLRVHHLSPNKKEKENIERMGLKIISIISQRGDCDRVFS